MTHLHHRLSALVDGELTRSARRRALAHLRACADCRRELRATMELKRRLTGLRPSEPSADLFASLDTVAGSGAVAGAPVGSRKPPVRRAFAGAGTLSLAVVALAYLVGAPEQTTAAAVAPPVDAANAEFAANSGGYGLSDPAVDALLAESADNGGSAAAAAQLAPVAFGIGAATAIMSIGRGDNSAAVRLLRRAVRAPERLSYRGVRAVRDFTSAGSDEIRIAVHHVPEQGTSYRVLDGDGSGAALFIDHSHQPFGGSLGADPVRVLARAYDVAVLGHDEVLGRPATIVGVGDDGSLTASFWIDDASGVVLDRELYNHGMLVRSSRFESLSISRHGFMLHPPPELNAPDGTDMSASDAATLGGDGWACPSHVGGDMSLAALARLGGSGEVVEVVYTDGISSASVFEQRGTLDESALDGYRRMAIGSAPVYVRNGLPSVWVWQSGETVYTMLSDAPPAQVAAAVADLPHETAGDDSALQRVGAGLRRIGTFLSPAG